MGIKVRQKGSFGNFEKFLKKASRTDDIARYAKYGEMGLQALRDATPVDSGLTATSWGYSLEVSDEGVKISWNNSNINNYVPIAVIVDKGHATGTGGYVEGRDYIDPSIQSVFDKIIDEVWKELRD